MDDAVLYVPTHVLDGVAKIALGNGFLAFVAKDLSGDVFVCGEFPDYSGKREMRRIRGPGFTGAVVQLQAAGQVLFARTASGELFWAGEEDDDGRVGRKEAPEWDELYFEGLHIEQITAGVGETLVYGWRDGFGADSGSGDISGAGEAVEGWEEEDYRRWDSGVLN